MQIYTKMCNGRFFVHETPSIMRHDETICVNYSTFYVPKFKVQFLFNIQHLPTFYAIFLHQK